MCGVFGFVAKDDGPLNLNILSRVATVTERRGPLSATTVMLCSSAPART